MRLKTVLIGIFALVFGISAALGVYFFGSGSSKDPKSEAVSVIVAAVDINRGQTLAEADLTKRDWPKDLVPEGAISDLDDALERTVAIPLVKGDVLVRSKLAVKGAGRGIAAISPAGMRAVTIQTPNVATGVAGFVVPGNRVDILLTMTNMGATDRTGGGSTITLLQNLEILAVDQRTDVPQDNRMESKEMRSVTLLVTPADATKLDLGQNKGTLRLTLRNPTDHETESVDLVTLTELGLNPSEPSHESTDRLPVFLPVAEPVRTVRPPKRIFPQIRTLRGTKSGLFRLPELDHDPHESTEEPPGPLANTTT